MKKDRDFRPRIEVCTDCNDSVGDPLSRRLFLKTMGGSIVAGTTATAYSGGLPRVSAAAKKSSKPAETYVKLLHDSLTEKQRNLIHFPYDHELGRTVKNNWNIVDPKQASIEVLYTSDQQELIRQILRNLVSEDGYERFNKQMTDDAGGLKKYTCAIFGSPGEAQFQWVLTGRHLTLRADGNSNKGAAFGGPIFYGHAVQFEEESNHPGNVWWHQGQLANELFVALDGKQREKALIGGEAPPDEPESVQLQGSKAKLPGLAGSELSSDQKRMMESTLKSMLGMFRKRDVAEALECIAKNGGVDSLRVAFYKEGDIAEDGVWDRWAIVGPAFVWYFRGSPHVHTWLHVGHRGAGDPEIRTA